MILGNNVEKINYDFTSIITSIIALSSGTVKPDFIKNIKNELNRFFKDSTCKEVIYTTNTDKMFFGIKVVPLIDADEVYEYLIGTDPVRIDKYIVEFDSQLFAPTLGLTDMEILALLIREISHLVGSSQPMEEARNDIDAYLAQNGTHIKVSQSIHYKEILAYGLKDYLSKSQSIFYNPDKSDMYADEFINSYGLGGPLTSAYDKVFKNNIKLYENSSISKFIVFSWTLSLYRHIKTQRISAIHTLNDLKTLTGSRLEIMEMDNVIRRIGRIDDDSVITEAESGGIRAKIKEKLRKARLNNLRMIDSTFYEISMQVKNVEDENDALYLMRQINTNLAIIDEYRNSKNCDDYELKEWSQMLDKFTQLRDKLTNTIVYKNKNYGLFVNYPDIVENRY